MNPYGTCKTCNRGLTKLKACITCREKEGFEACKAKKSLKDNPYKDSDSYAWDLGYMDGLQVISMTEDYEIHPS
jgi:predicted amidophosphoribosyltransferase